MEGVILSSFEAQLNGIMRKKSLDKFDGTGLWIIHVENYAERIVFTFTCEKEVGKYDPSEGF